MATLDKLWIKNIRSYGSKHASIIEFKGPLTLILGDNGSGKTTILECIRWSLTGVFPPGSGSGKSFVNIGSCSESSTLGQVNLTFRLVKTNSMMAISRGLRKTARKLKVNFIFISILILKHIIYSNIR